MDILTHILAATTASSVVAIFTLKKTKWKVMAVCMGVVAGTLPDIDVISLWSGFDSTFGSWFWLPESGKQIYYAKYWYSHHAFIHSLLSATTISAALALICARVFRSLSAAWIGVAFFGGYLSHLLLDMVTPGGPWGGIALLFPLDTYVGGWGKVWWWNNYDIFLYMALSALASLMALFVKGRKIGKILLSIVALLVIVSATTIINSDNNFNQGEHSVNEQKSLQIQQQRLSGPIYSLIYKLDGHLKVMM